MDKVSIKKFLSWRFILALVIPITIIFIALNSFGLFNKTDSLPRSKTLYQEKEIASLRGVTLDTAGPVKERLNIEYPGDVMLFKNDKMLFTFYRSSPCANESQTVSVNGDVIIITYHQHKSFIKKACEQAIDGPYAYIVDLPSGFSEKESIKAVAIKNDGETNFDLSVIKKTDIEIENIPNK